MALQALPALGVSVGLSHFPGAADPTPRVRGPPVTGRLDPGPAPRPCDRLGSPRPQEGGLRERTYPVFAAIVEGGPV